MKLPKYLRSNRQDNNKTRKLTTVLFVIYVIALFWILLFKLGVQFSYMEDRSVNLIPFRQAFSNGRIDVVEILLNVVIFVPLGMYAGVLFKRWNFGNNLFFFFLTSLLFEALQFVLRVGAFDVTDSIANTLGGLIGLIIFQTIEKLFNDSAKAQKFINIVAATATVLMISLLLLLKMNMLPVRYQ